MNRPGVSGMGEKARNGVGGHVLAEIVALHHRAAERAQDLRLLSGFHALDDARQLQVPAEIDDGLDDVAAGRLRLDILDEAAVDLDLVQRQTMDVAQARKAGAEVVERDVHPERLQRLQAFATLVEIAHQGGLGDFEVDALGGARRCLR